MNGPEPRIEIFKPFGEAFDLMKKILFQPFDIKKWFVIGFAAFLANFAGGFGIHGNPFSAWSSRDDRREIARKFHEIGPIGNVDWPIIALIVIGALILLAIVIVLKWIGARGRFMFTDCIMHNRGAIVGPWNEFRTEGNSFFLFSLVIALAIFTLVILAILPVIAPLVLHGPHPKPTFWFWIALGFFLLFVVAISIAWTVISHFMVPIMYRQRCRARQAFVESIGLINAHPGPILLFLLFFILIAICAAIVGCAVVCVTCCIAAIPYIGTVILLPIPVTLYGFTLMFLRQFGPDYDVWQGISPPAPPTTSPPPEPPPLQT